MSGPLTGVRIVDMTMNVLGPYAAQLLGDMGADVIKIEPLDGDTMRGVGPSRHKGMGPYFLNLNRSKRSVAVDLKTPRGIEVLHSILDKADALVFSFRPKAMARLGLSYEALSARNPRLIYCGASGFGQAGPYADRPAYDDLIQAAIGLPVLQARGVEEPTYVATALADRVVGMALSGAVGMALFHREKTGRGQAIEIPMFETMAEFVMGDHLYGLTFEPPLGKAGYARMTSPGRKPYRTLDGYIGVVVYNDKHWRRFFKIIGRDDLAADPRYASIAARTDNMPAVHALLDEMFPTRSTAEWYALLTDADIPAMPLVTPDALVNDAHMTAVDFFEVVEHPTEGPIRVMRVPQRWSDSQPEATRPVPVLGQHTAEVLQEIGYAKDAVDALVAERVIRCSQAS